MAKKNGQFVIIYYYYYIFFNVLSANSYENRFSLAVDNRRVRIFIINPSIYPTLKFLYIFKKYIRNIYITIKLPI